MSNCSEIVTILDRIINSVNQGTLNYCTIFEYIKRRIEAEEKIAFILQSIIPQQYDQKDSITNSFMQSLLDEVDSRKDFMKKIQIEILNPEILYVKTLNDQQKTIKNQAEKVRSKAQKVSSNTAKAQNEVQNQKNKCKDLTAKQLEKQNSNVIKAITEYQKKSQEEIDESIKISSKELPGISKEFTNFESIRLPKLHDLTLSFIQLKKNLNKSMINGYDNVKGKLTKYDPNDRSKQYITRIFNPTNDFEEYEDKDIFAVAISDYKSTNPNDLNFVRGDKIKILNQHLSGWWEGQIDDIKGFFPKTYVMPENNIKLKNDPIGAVFLVKKDFEAKGKNDINLLDGDLVFVDYVSNGRCFGINKRNNQKGYFSFDCLDSNFRSCKFENDPDFLEDNMDWLNDSMRT